MMSGSLDIFSDSTSLDGIPGYTLRLRRGKQHVVFRREAQPTRMDRCGGRG